MSRYTHHSMRDHNLWDPFAIFSVINPARGYQTCVGYADSKGRRCENAILASNRDRIRRELSRLALDMPSFPHMESKLRFIARLCLCRAVHQGQVDDVLSQWATAIRQEQNHLELTQSLNHFNASLTTRLAQASSVTISDQLSALQSQLSLLHAQLRTQPAPIPMLSVSIIVQDTLFGVQPAASISSSNPGNSQHAPRGSSLNSNPGGFLARTNSAHGIRLRQAAAVPTENSPPESAQNGTVPDPVTSGPGARPILAGHTVETPTQRTPNATGTCGVTHVSRRSTDEDCVICTEPCTNSSLLELVWCKGTCGRNFHKTCFDEWRIQSANVGRRLRCVICRGDWAAACIHDQQEPEYDMWSEDDLGLVRLFSQVAL